MEYSRKKNFSILVALPEEFNSVVEIFDPYLAPAEKGKAERVGILPRADAGVTGEFAIRPCKAMANIWSAAATAALLADYEPDILIFIGIAAALQPRHVRLGDVVIVDGLRSRAFQKICDLAEVKGDPAFSSYGKKHALRAASPDLPDISPRTRQLVQTYSKGLDKHFESPEIESEITDGVQGSSKSAHRSCKIHCEQIFSWDLVLDSSSYRDDLVRTESKSYALDMESLGFYSVIEECAKGSRLLPDAIVFRGISDYAAFKAPSNALRNDWRKVAAQNAAKAALRFLQTADMASIGSKSV